MGGSSTQKASATSLTAADVEDLLVQRKAARGARNWTEADRIRDQLDAAGIVIEDGPDGTTWRRK